MLIRSAIKRIQSVTLATSGGVGSAAITAVNTAKSVILLRTIFSGGIGQQVSVAFASATSVSIAATNGEVVGVQATVIEFN